MAACANPANHRYTPAAGLPALREAVAEKTLRDSGLTVAPEQVLITNGGKQAVYQAFATLLDPGDEVLLPAPYWTTYPEAIALAGGVPVPVVADETHGLPGRHRPAGGGADAAHQGAAVLLAVEPDRRGLPAGAGRGHRPVGGRAGDLGRHRRDLRAPDLRRTRGTSSMPVVAPEIADRCVVRERRREDVRHDGLAGGLDDRPEGRRQGRDQPAVAPDLQRLQRRAAGRAHRGRRPARRRRRDAVGVRPAAPADRRAARRDPGGELPGPRRAPSTRTRR